MNTNIKQIIIWVLVIGVFVAGLGYLLVRNSVPSGPSNLGGFTQCLKYKGAVFYGAFWCPHCNNQKKLFGTAAKLLPYVECSTLDGKSQLQVCIDKKIDGYPTWEFADGSREGGEVSLEKLAEKTGCELPADQAETTSAEAPVSEAQAPDPEVQIESNGITSPNSK